MTLTLAKSFSLDIMLSCQKTRNERRDETAIYHPDDTVSGFLRIIGHSNTVLDSVSLVLEGEPKQTKRAGMKAEVCAGIVRIWQSSPVGGEVFSAIQHRVSVSLSIAHIASQPPSLSLLTEYTVSQTNPAFAVQQ